MSTPIHGNTRQNQGVGLDNEELIRRYQAGEPLNDLTAAAGMSRSGLYDRLHRLGVPRRTGGPAPDDETIAAALAQHRSVNAAAKALGVPRNRLAGDAVRLGHHPRPAHIPADLADRYHQEQSLDRVAAHYNTSAITVGRWLRSLGIPLQPGRKPRDG
jgi:hypothetical protein